MLNPDVTEILDDPEVGGGQPFLIRRPKQVRTKGSVTLVTEESAATGNIQPADKSATQDTNEDQLNEQIVIRTTAYLQAGTRDASGVYQADEIIWNGIRWRVTRVENWIEWGFVSAYATRVRE